MEQREYFCCGKARGRIVRALCALTTGFLFAGAIAAPLGAQTYPSKPVHLITPFPAGGGADIVGRIIGQKLAEQLGQPVVPKTVPAPAATSALNSPAKSRPDGYTILHRGVDHHQPQPLQEAQLRPDQGFCADLAGRTDALFVPFVRTSLPVKNLKELVAYAKANPGKLNYGSSGMGASSHLASELFKSLAKINVLHVPYKGAGQALSG